MCALTSPAVLASHENCKDQEQDEEQESGQNIAQLVEEMSPALRNDDIDDVVVPA